MQSLYQCTESYLHEKNAFMNLMILCYITPSISTLDSVEWKHNQCIVCLRPVLIAFQFCFLNLISLQISGHACFRRQCKHVEVFILTLLVVSSVYQKDEAQVISMNDNKCLFFQVYNMLQLYA